MRLDLADLRLFVTIVGSGSITSGAATMNLALASASQRLSGMEAALGVPLLERSRRGVRPTAAGTLLLRHARALLAGAEQMHGELRGFATGLRGRIRLPANTGAVLGFLPEALCGFLAAHPGLDIALEERPSVETVRVVADGGAELGILADSVDPGALHVQPLCADPLALVVPESHRLAGRDAVDLTAVLEEKFVGLQDAALEAHLAEHAARRGARLNYRIRLRAPAAIGGMVAAGIGVAILPHGVAAEVAGPGLGVVPLRDAWARRRLALCARSLDGLTPQARLLWVHLASFVSGML
ncbi:MAG TPA: LysR family transcriptional regulator [Acetobacteraceae bacterium]|nr:LysR family transcriptional regulator [Acetobacteraceae bacterium]